MKTVALHIVRDSAIWVSTAKAAAICGVSTRWVQLHKTDFNYKRKGVRNLEFELSSVYEVRETLKQHRLVG